MTKLADEYEGSQTKCLLDVEKSTGPNICLVELLRLETIASSRLEGEIKSTRGNPLFPRKWFGPS